MSLNEELRNAAAEIASSPKVLGGVSAATTSLGLASITDVITGSLAIVATSAGIIATFLLGRVHWAAYKNHMLQNKILRKQLIEVGGDPDEE